MVFLKKKCLIPLKLQHLLEEEESEHVTTGTKFMGEMGKRYEQVTSLFKETLGFKYFCLWRRETGC